MDVFLVHPICMLEGTGDHHRPPPRLLHTTTVSTLRLSKAELIQTDS